MTDRNPDHPLGSFRNRWPGGWWQQVQYTHETCEPYGNPYGALQHDEKPHEVEPDYLCTECGSPGPVTVFDRYEQYVSADRMLCSACLRKLADMLDTEILPIVKAIAERDAEQERASALEDEE